MSQLPASLHALSWKQTRTFLNFSRYSSLNLFLGKQSSLRRNQIMIPTRCRLALRTPTRLVVLGEVKLRLQTKPPRLPMAGVKRHKLLPQLPSSMVGVAILLHLFRPRMVGEPILLHLFRRLLPLLPLRIVGELLKRHQFLSALHRLLLSPSQLPTAGGLLQALPPLRMLLQMAGALHRRLLSHPPLLFSRLQLHPGEALLLRLGTLLSLQHRLGNGAQAGNEPVLFSQVLQCSPWETREVSRC